MERKVSPQHMRLRTGVQEYCGVRCNRSNIRGTLYMPYVAHNVTYIHDTMIHQCHILQHRCPQTFEIDVGVCLDEPGIVQSQGLHQAAKCNHPIHEAVHYMPRKAWGVAQVL